MQKGSSTIRDDDLLWSSGGNHRLRRQGGNHQPLGMKEAKDANPQLPGGTDTRRQQNER
jgi:hypothetical protein